MKRRQQASPTLAIAELEPSKIALVGTWQHHGSFRQLAAKGANTRKERRKKAA